MAAYFYYNAALGGWVLQSGAHEMTWNNLDNFVEFGQPYAPGEPGFDEALYNSYVNQPGFRPKLFVHQNIATDMVRFSLPNIEEFDVSEKFFSSRAEIPDGIYSMHDLERLGITDVGGVATDEIITTNLYNLTAALTSKNSALCTCSALCSTVFPRIQRLS